MKILEKNITNLYGEHGKHWLANLPNLIAQMELTYRLSNLKPAKNLSYHYVLSGLQDDQPIILKLGLDSDELKQEARALKAFAEYGAVKVYAENNGVLLLERAISGISLKSYFPEKEFEAINITMKAIEHLHQAPKPKEGAFPHIKDWLVALDNDWEIPAASLQKARQLRDTLLQTSTKEVLLHGDLHHDNILQNGQDWVVIDPKGVIGEPAYEVAAFIRNPIPDLLELNNARDIIHNRILRVSQLLELPSQRISDWCLVQAVLGWVWALEDGCDVSYFQRLTENFER